MAAGTNARILERLGEQERREGKLPPYVQFYRELLQIQIRVQSRITVAKPGFDAGLACDRLSQGIPLLMFNDFAPDWDEVQSLFEQVSAWAGKGSKAPPGETEKMERIARDRSRLIKLAGDWFAGQPLDGIATAEGVDGDLLASVAAATLRPFLIAYARLLLPEVGQELWRRRYCPVCGGSPDFAYLDRENGSRWLVCSRCDADWLFLRLECPGCGTQNQNDLAYFAEEGDASPYRLYVCEKCHTYIKAVDLRRTAAEVLLPLERILTLNLDRQAQSKGYQPCLNRPQTLPV
jgi:FdhE protein